MFDGIEFGTGLLGLFMSFPLLAMARQRAANFWLGMFILSVSLLSLAFRIYAEYPSLFGLFDWPLAAVGPFFYFYLRSLLGMGNGRRQAWHVLPLILLVAALLGGRVLLSGRDLFVFVFGGEHPEFGLLLLLFQIQAAVYAVAVLYRLTKYRHMLRDNYSSTKDRDFIWLSWLSLSFLALLLIWIPATLLGGNFLYALIAGRLITLFIVGWCGLRQSDVFTPATPSPAEADHRLTPQAPSTQESVAASPVDATEPDKYVRSGMTEAARELIGQRLLRRMSHERDYLEPDVKLTDLAERIGTSPQLLSQYLNDVLGLSFFDYINGLRVAEVQKLMRDEANGERTLLELAYQAGFNSKSTFNASFKNLSGMAPSNWRNLHVRTSAPTG